MIDKDTYIKIQEAIQNCMKKYSPASDDDIVKGVRIGLNIALSAVMRVGLEDMNE